MAGLEILDAKYGAVGSAKDKKSVTENVKQKISADKQSVSFVVSTTNLGIQDPAPGNPKEMDIQYALDGIQYNEKIRDGNTFAAKLKEPAPRSPAGYLLMLYGAIFKNVVSSAALCINVAGIVMAYNLGWYFGFGVLWAIIAVIFPFAAFWLIPFIVILARAAGGVDFVTLY